MAIFYPILAKSTLWFLKWRTIKQKLILFFSSIWFFQTLHPPWATSQQEPVSFFLLTLCIFWCSWQSTLGICPSSCLLSSSFMSMYLLPPNFILPESLGAISNSGLTAIFQFVVRTYLPHLHAKYDRTCLLFLFSMQWSKFISTSFVTWTGVINF